MTKKSLLLVTIGLMMTSLLATLESTVTGTALPTIIGELGGLDQMAWVTSAYLLSAAIVVPIVGKLADIYGRKRWYMLGLAIFMTGSALCGVAQNMTQLILFRALQGLGGGMLVPVAQVIVGDLFPGAARAKVQGAFAGLVGLASILGPKVGGWIVEALPWRWVFYINLPFGILSVALLGIYLRETVGDRNRSVDYLGAFTLAGGSASLLLALDLGNREYGWSSWQVISLLTAAALLLTAFVAVERKVKEPLLPLSLFRSRVFAVSSTLIFIVGAGMLGTIMFIPLFMQGALGVGASKSGSVLTPMMLALVVGSILGSRLLLKVTYRTQLFLGMVLMAASFLLMSGMTTATKVGALQAYMVLTGLGMGLAMPTVTIAVQNAFPAEQRGVVTSAVAFARTIGGSVGTALFGIMLNQRAGGLIGDRVAALAAGLPAQAAPVLEPIKATALQDAGKLFGMLLRPDLTAQLPEAVRTPLLGLLRESLADSLQTVFLVSLGAAVAAALVALLIGRARMPVKEDAAAVAAD